MIENSVPNGIKAFDSSQKSTEFMTSQLIFVEKPCACSIRSTQLIPDHYFTQKLGSSVSFSKRVRHSFSREKAGLFRIRLNPENGGGTTEENLFFLSSPFLMLSSSGREEWKKSRRVATQTFNLRRRHSETKTWKKATLFSKWLCLCVDVQHENQRKTRRARFQREIKKQSLDEWQKRALSFLVVTVVTDAPNSV